jgi:hypothetical protein
MPFNFDKSGLEQFRKKLGGVAERRDIELPSDDFMNARTQYSTFAAMLKASGLATPEGDQWEAFVKQSTPFENWRQMIVEAEKERLRRELNL